MVGGVAKTTRGSGGFQYIYAFDRSLYLPARTDVRAGLVCMQ